MLRLKLLGGVALDGPGGPVRGRAVQRRQLSLLALLAGSRVGPVSRDKLVGLLWPELAAGRARSLLSDAVHVLRKSLGDGAIRASGDELGVDPDVVWCDVPAFRAAIEAGDPAGALVLYDGPFLDGFHVSGAVELERWVDGERGEAQRVARRAAGDLMAGAERAGDEAAAAQWARRALTIDPYDEVAARDLIRLLAAAGDRAGALRAHESFAALLRSDLELDVSPETAALVDQIHAEAAEGRVRSLAILPLENLSADPEQEYFAAGMHDALIGEIARVRGLRVISRTSTLAFRGGRESAPAIARALDVDAVLEGTVLRAGGRVRIHLQLIRARPEERHLWTRTYDREIDDVLALHREVTRAVAHEISGQLTPGGEGPSTRASGRVSRRTYTSK